MCLLGKYHLAIMPFSPDAGTTDLDLDEEMEAEPPLSRLRPDMGGKKGSLA